MNKFTKEDFEEMDGEYFIGHVVDADGSPWVNEQTLEMIIEELNKRVIDCPTFTIPGRPEVIFAPLLPDEKHNWIHLN